MHMLGPLAAAVAWTLLWAIVFAVTRPAANACKKTHLNYRRHWAYRLNYFSLYCIVFGVVLLLSGPLTSALPQ